MSRYSQLIDAQPDSYGFVWDDEALVVASRRRSMSVIQSTAVQACAEPSVVVASEKVEVQNA